jgi:hypothetical protein
MYLLAVALHTAWDSIGTITGYIVLAVIALAALSYITHQLREQALGDREAEVLLRDRMGPGATGSIGPRQDRHGRPKKSWPCAGGLDGAEAG